MLKSASRKGLAIVLGAALTLSTGVGTLNVAPKKAEAAATTVEGQRFLQLYNQLTSPTNGYFSPEGIPYHAIETLLSEAPDYGHMSTSEAYSYWLWLETLYGYYTGDWTHLEKAWDNMEKYIIPINEGDGKEEQPTMSYYNPNSPAVYAPEKPYPDQYPAPLGNSKTPGKDPLDAELKSTYGNNQTYLMHWLIDVDNWYGYGNLLNPSHTVTYVNTFQRGEQESVFEAVTHPSQDNKTFGKPGEGFMSLFTKESSAPSAQWRYTNASDADARVIQVMYWAKELGYNNQTYLNKAKKMGDYLRYDMYDKYFEKIGSSQAGNPTPGTGKDASMYLMSWYSAWGGGLNGGNWAWRIGASHAHQAYQNPVAAYALSTTAGGLIPASPTAQTDWNTSLQRQLEFYTWLQSSEGAIGGGATNSWNGDYSAYPAGVSTFYGMAYQQAPVYHDPDSNQWFGFQAWPIERVAEMYYILASSGDHASMNYQMAKRIMDRWVDYALDYTFVNQKPVTDANGYYLDAAGQKVLGGANPAIATTSAPGEFYIPGTLEWSGQPDTWNGYSSYTGNPTYKTVTKDPGQDVGVLGSYIKALSFYAAATKADTGNYTTLGNQAKTTAKTLLDMVWSYNDGKGIVKPESRADYFRFFTKETYIPSAWSGTNGQGASLPGTNGIASDPAKGGTGVYISYVDQRPKITQDPMWSYLSNLYNTSYNTTTKKWENGTPTFTYHRFWAQVDIATAYAEYDRLINSSAVTTAPAAPTALAATAGNAQVTLSWTASSGATSYNVKRATTSGGPYTTVASGVTGTTYTNTGLTNGTTYYYVISAVNSAGESTNSTQASATPAAAVTAPAAPTGLVATAGNAQAVLTWTASSGATSYNVKRATISGGPYTTIATGIAGTTYTNTGLTNGTTYYYVVSAVNSAGESSNSAQASVTPVAPITIPAAPTTLTSTAGNAQVTLNWSASTGATSYNVKRTAVSGGAFTTIANVTGTSFTDSGLTNGTTYYYVVTAVNSAGESGNSPIASATPAGSTTPSSLVVQYKLNNSNANDNTIYATFNIKNTGTTAVNMSDLKLRYYITKDTTSASLNFWTDWAQVGSNTVSGSFGSVSPTKTNADTYLEISFSSAAGSIAPGSQSGEIQIRIAKNDWSNFSESNDYSFDGTKSSFADWNKVTLYQSGSLVWGIEP
jgi:fibronectin type 3 domain-containing protein